MQIFRNPNYNFIRWRWHAIVLSLLVVIAGAATMATRGMPLGIDFSGGTIVVVQFDQAVSEDQVRRAVTNVGGEVGVQRYGEAEDRQWLIRLPQTLAREQGASLEQGSQQIEQALQKAGLPSFQVIQRDLVGPVIGD